MKNQKDYRGHMQHRIISIVSLSFWYGFGSVSQSAQSPCEQPCKALCDYVNLAKCRRDAYGLGAEDVVTRAP